MSIKCCNCRKELKKSEVHRTFYNEKYYHNYHVQYRKGFHWCEACWEEIKKANDAYVENVNADLIEYAKKLGIEL
jgi:hypothetical protein